ncbi:MAG TPA: SRPBCC domain-containing protein [Rhizomicrobium sp.]|jgi:uncharacterized protein YndB with AHSA1/START domain|nr:SRPBCC domain-containing protein [Rhizomicrobium sp.]
MRNAIHGIMVAGALIFASHANAAVVDSTPAGFSLQETAHIAATPDEVYDALVHPAKWWNSQHTFSQNAANLTLDARGGGCFCENWNGGSVQHGVVVDAEPGKILRLRGPLGPFQGQGVDGALTFTLKAADGGTDLTLDNTIGGYMKGGFGQWPQAADGMLSDMVAHLKTYAESAH